MPQEDLSADERQANERFAIAIVKELLRPVDMPADEYQSYRRFAINCLAGALRALPAAQGTPAAQETMKRDEGACAKLEGESD